MQYVITKSSRHIRTLRFRTQRQESITIQLNTLQQEKILTFHKTRKFVESLYIFFKLLELDIKLL